MRNKKISEILIRFGIVQVPVPKKNYYKLINISKVTSMKASVILF